MTHVLTECDAPGQRIIWTLAESLWEKKNPNTWPEITNIGSIIRGSLANFTTAEGQRDPGSNRFFRILISESAHLIWRIRCRRVIDLGSNEDLWQTNVQIGRAWRSQLEHRLILDQAMSHRKYEKKAINKETVLRTWRGLLKNEEDLPDDWLCTPAGFLVGIGFPEWPSGLDPPDPP